jgi:hypothetical protein
MVVLDRFILKKLIKITIYKIKMLHVVQKKISKKNFKKMAGKISKKYQYH